MKGFGARHRSVATARMLHEIEADAKALLEDASRDAAADRLLLHTGELAQALLDSAAGAHGDVDDFGDLERRLAALTHTAARAWGERGARAAHAQSLRAQLAALPAASFPETLAVVVPAGFAAQELSPERCARAAREWRRFRDRPPVVLAGRPAGTTLGAVVAWACGAERAITVGTARSGASVARALSLSPALAHAVLGVPATTTYAIVDDSASGAAAIADWLHGHGVGRDRIVFLPGDVPAGEPRVLVEAAERHDLSAGAWRALLFDDKTTWPPAAPVDERRKWRFSEGGRRWLAKFAGYGRHGERKLDRARRLARAGFIAAPREFRDGFLVTEWIEAENVSSLPDGAAREDLVETVAAYLAFLAREFPVKDSGAGASPPQLLAVARHYASARLGRDAADLLGRWDGLLAGIAEHARRVATDNRLHRWEWLRLPGGGWMKADALDHAETPDGAGPQDIAWDVAGAVVELSLADDETAVLLARLAREAGYRPDPSSLRFHELAYCAHQLGVCSHALAACGADREEAMRLDAEARRYTARLQRLLELPIPAGLPGLIVPVGIGPRLR